MGWNRICSAGSDEIKADRRGDELSSHHLDTVTASGDCISDLGFGISVIDLVSSRSGWTRVAADHAFVFFSAISARKGPKLCRWKGAVCARQRGSVGQRMANTEGGSGGQRTHMEEHG